MSNSNIKIEQENILLFSAVMKASKGKLNIEVKQKMQYKKPLGKDDKRVIINICISVEADNTETVSTDEFCINTECEFLISYEVTPKDFDSFIENDVIPVVLPRVSEIIDNMLTSMGHTQLHLLSKTSQE